MKWFLTLCAALLLGIFPLACSDNNSNPYSPKQPTSTPTITFTPTITNTPTATDTPCNFPSQTCTPTNTDTPTNTFTPTPTLTPFTVTVMYGGSYNFSPASVTINAGSTVIWDSSFGSGTAFHSLYIDTGNGSTCGPNPPSHGYPATVVFSSSGTYIFHCGYHANCLTSCSGCNSGMVGTVHVQ